jgi:ubiquinone/menaquinone biosynthesis C-methylase UbiE
MTSLPYFDSILDRFRHGDAVVEQVFGRHVHWGYWDDPRRADGSLADFAAATERLSRRVCAAAGVRDGQSVLDVGCGFGGTLLELNEEHSDVALVGLNIDRRQLERGRGLVEPRRGNRVEWVVGDACRLPFADESFDVVLAIECIFHFGDRLQFFREVNRVLRPGGRWALCDFVPRLVVPVLWDFLEARFKPAAVRLYGPSDMRCTLPCYRRLVRAAGLGALRVEDVTANTLPTYQVLRPLVRQLSPEPDQAEQVIRRVERTTRLGLLRYLILAGRKGVGRRA